MVVDEKNFAHREDRCGQLATESEFLYQVSRLLRC
jgi:hypothetical protein